MSFFLFPGQGSQSPGMGRDFYEGSAAARDVFDEGAGIAGEGFLSTLFDGPAEALTDTRNAQPALLTMGVAVARYLETLGVRPSGCAGHSVGEIPALVVLGCLDFADAFRLTQLRARVMSEDVPEGGMAAVIGMGADKIEELLPEGVGVANFNGPQQTIISGTKAGLEVAQGVLKEAGARRVMPLKVSGAFHSFLMEDGSQKLRAALEDVAFSAPKARFVSSVSACEETDPTQIKGLLWKQLTSPVRWTEVMALVGQVKALEVGPGRVLQGIAKRAEGAPTIELAGTFDAAQALA